MKPGDRVRLDRRTNNTVGRPERFFTRLGTIVTGKHRISSTVVRVQWDGCQTAERLHMRLLELVEACHETS